MYIAIKKIEINKWLDNENHVSKSYFEYISKNIGRPFYFSIETHSYTNKNNYTR